MQCIVSHPEGLRKTVKVGSDARGETMITKWALWCRCNRGVYQVEYLIVLILVAMAAGLSIGALALPLWEYHQSLQMFVVLPLP